MWIHKSGTRRFWSLNLLSKRRDFFIRIQKYVSLHTLVHLDGTEHIITTYRPFATSAPACPGYSVTVEFDLIDHKPPSFRSVCSTVRGRSAWWPTRSSSFLKPLEICLPSPCASKKPYDLLRWSNALRILDLNIEQGIIVGLSPTPSSFCVSIQMSPVSFAFVYNIAAYPPLVCLDPINFNRMITSRLTS